MQFNGIWHRLMQEDNNRAAQKIKVTNLLNAA